LADARRRLTAYAPGVASELIVICYASPEDAERVIETARRLQSEHLLDIADGVYVTRDVDGIVSVYERINRPIAAAALGAFWGTLIGKVFGRPLLGAGLGALAGALTNAPPDTDDIDDDFVRDLSSRLPPGSAAVFALVRRATPDKVVAELGRYGGTVLHTSVSEEREARFQQALDEAHRMAKLQRSVARPRRRVHSRRVLRHSPSKPPI